MVVDQNQGHLRLGPVAPASPGDSSPHGDDPRHRPGQLGGLNS